MTNKFKILPERRTNFDVGYFNFVGICICKHADYDHKDNYEFDSNNKLKRHHCKDCLCENYKEITRIRQSQYFELRKSRDIRLQRLETRVQTIEKELNEMPVNFRAFVFYNQAFLRLQRTPKFIRGMIIFFCYTDLFSNNIYKKEFTI